VENNCQFCERLQILLMRLRKGNFTINKLTELVNTLLGQNRIGVRPPIFLGGGQVMGY